MDLQLLLMLIAGHYLADFALQPQYMAEKKQLVFIEPIGFHALTAHAFIHALVAGLISSNFIVAIAVGITHWLIDFGRGSKLLDDEFPHTKGSRNVEQSHGLYGIHLDQALHVLVIYICVILVA
jgi:hypothetical protein